MGAAPDSRFGRLGVLGGFLGWLPATRGVQAITSDRWDALAVHPDSPGHYVSGLLGWNYLTAGLPADPIGFAQTFYLHYPAVAIGQWPPGYHLVQALWALAFSPSPGAILWLQAVALAAAATLGCAMLRPTVGLVGAITATALFLIAKPTQLVVSGVMAEPLTAALCLGAAASYVSYLELPRSSAAVGFGLLAGLALLTKGSAIFLALLPASALLCGRADLMRRWDFWLPAGVTLAVAGSWYLGLEQLPSWGAEFRYSAEAVMRRNAPLRGGLIALASKGRAALELFGPGLGSLAALGFVTGFLGPARRRALAPLPAVLGVYLASALLFHFALRESGEPRHLLPAAPVGFGFAFAGALWAVHRVIRGAHRTQAAVTVAICLLASGGVRLLSETPTDLDRAAAVIASDRSLDEAVILVSSQAGGEAAFVAEVAALEPRPRRVVLRGAKMLADSGWRSQRYEPRFADIDTLATYLQSIPVGVLVLDETPSRGRTVAHPQQLREAIERYDTRWRRIPFESDHLEIYRSTRPDLRRRQTIRIDLSRRIGKVLELPAPQP